MNGGVGGCCELQCQVSHGGAIAYFSFKTEYYCFTILCFIIHIMCYNMCFREI